VVGALQRLLDEVSLAAFARHGAELAVLNTNQGCAQVFERIMSLTEEALRGEVVEALCQDGEQEADAGRTDATVHQFEQAVDAGVNSYAPTPRSCATVLWRCGVR
jgi:hypothetical protein